MAPLVDSDFCWAHDPANAEAAAEARRLGGLRRKREGSLRVAYDLGDLASILDLRRVLEIAALDTSTLDNGVARNRTLMAAVHEGATLIEKGELAARIDKLEAAVLQNPDRFESNFDAPEASSDFLADDASP
jgi:hypothetical protein